MRLAKNIKILPFPLDRIFKGMAFYGTIYLRRDIYEDLLKRTPSPKNVGVLVHEQTHLKRLDGRIGFIKSVVYWFCPKVRYMEEIEANREQLRYLKKVGGNFNFEERAKHLSGFRYLFCTSYKKAFRDLKEIWKEV